MLLFNPEFENFTVWNFIKNYHNQTQKNIALRNHHGWANIESFDPIIKRDKKFYKLRFIDRSLKFNTIKGKKTVISSLYGIVLNENEKIFSN